ncbi:MAG: hypothetical protein D6702_11175 [Planctomycetota bacterium]|nr:MAG: hypothetical protein D6702_11175 [Planctomycetota bacterium]
MPSSSSSSRARALLRVFLAGWAIGGVDAAFYASSRFSSMVAAEVAFSALLPGAVLGLLFLVAALAQEALLGRLAARRPLLRRLLTALWAAGGTLLLAWTIRRRLILGFAPSLPAGSPPLLATALVFLGARLIARRRPAAAIGFLVLLALVTAGFALSGIGAPQPLTAGRGPGDRRPPTDRNLVLVTWDTVRADTLPVYGGAGLETPNLARLAEEGVLFEDCQAVAPQTGPAHASILTGLFPPAHGLRSNGDELARENATTLAEYLGRAGYRTAAFVSAAPVSAKYGFSAGFQFFDGRPSNSPGERLLRLVLTGSMLLDRVLPAGWHPASASTRGEVTLERALSWLETGPDDRPFFLWVHFYDAHSPYRPPEPWRSRVQARAAEGPRPADPSLLEQWVLQRGEIELLDDLTGRLLAGLERLDPGLRRTTVALLSDHGECFGEGGLKCSHHRSLFQATQRIAGVLRPAGEMDGIDRGGRRQVPVSQVDLFPTVCELLGLPVPAVQGRSLVELLAAPSGEADRGLYMEAFARLNLADRRHAWRIRPWTYAVDQAGRETVYHDRRGEVSLSEVPPEMLARLRSELAEFLAGIQVAGPHTALDPETEADLRELGYTD